MIGAIWSSLTTAAGVYGTGSKTKGIGSTESGYNEAIEGYGAPEIFNTDQGSQFTSDEFTRVLKQHDIQISMDVKGCWLDNVFVERLWRSVKYEEVYLKAYESIGNACNSLDQYFVFYNNKCRYPSLDRQRRDSLYYHDAVKEAA